MTELKTRDTIQVSDKWEAAFLQAKGHVSHDSTDPDTHKVVFDFPADRPRRQIVGQDALNLLRSQIEQVADEATREQSLERLSALEEQLKDVPPIEMSARADLREYDMRGLVVAKTFKQEAQSIQSRIRKHYSDGGGRR